MSAVPRRLLLLLVLVLVPGACAPGENASAAGGAAADATDVDDPRASLPEGAEAISLTGAVLRAPDQPPEVRAAYEANLAAAEADLAAAPDDVEARIWVGRRLGYLARYRDAIDAFGAAMDIAPDDARLYRHRGHRYITVRELEKAEADLRRAAELERGQPDEVEPDGLPNERGIPTSTLQGNIWYHLGLAHYLQGELEQALLAYREGMEVADHDDMRVATAYWLVNTLLRLGMEERADSVLAEIHDDMDVIESTAYMDVLRLHKGETTSEELLGPGGEDATLQGTTTAYGVGNWHFVNGRREQAYRLWERMMEGDSQWAAFGYIAAEAELARAGRTSSDTSGDEG
ncbi:MAG: hypothetical protein KY453_06335 [Gemmatimonadetes bacterium]|nr:hypothetical protein [Gemmatimonadota bacterium]